MTTEVLNKHDEEIALGNQVLDFYMKLVGGQDEDDATNFVDVLATLLHTARGYGMPFHLFLCEAEAKFNEELAQVRAEAAR